MTAFLHSGKSIIMISDSPFSQNADVSPCPETPLSLNRPQPRAPPSVRGPAYLLPDKHRRTIVGDAVAVADKNVLIAETVCRTMSQSLVTALVTFDENRSATICHIFSFTIQIRAGNCAAATNSNLIRALHAAAAIVPRDKEIEPAVVTEDKRSLNRILAPSVTRRAMVRGCSPEAMCMVESRRTSCIPSQKDPNVSHGVPSSPMMKLGSMAFQLFLPPFEHIRGPSSRHSIMLRPSADSGRRLSVETSPIADVFFPKVEQLYAIHQRSRHLMMSGAHTWLRNPARSRASMPEYCQAKACDATHATSSCRQTLPSEVRCPYSSYNMCRPAQPSPSCTIGLSVVNDCAATLLPVSTSPKAAMSKTVVLFIVS